MAGHDLEVKSRISGNPLVVVIGCKICGWNGALNPRYEQKVLASTAECPGTEDPASAVKALLAAAAATQKVTITLWDNCFSWQEALCGPLPAFRERSSLPPDSPPDLPPRPATIIGPVTAIKFGNRGEWTVWTPGEIYYSHHGWRHSVPIQPPADAVRPDQY